MSVCVREGTDPAINRVVFLIFFIAASVGIRPDLRDCMGVGEHESLG